MLGRHPVEIWSDWFELLPDEDLPDDPWVPLDHVPFGELPEWLVFPPSDEEWAAATRRRIFELRDTEGLSSVRIGMTLRHEGRPSQSGSLVCAFGTMRDAYNAEAYRRKASVE
jgi:hypothetical protein